MSRRTDGGAGSKQAQQEIRTGKYGESKAIAEAQAGAPLAGGAMPNPTMPALKATPLFAASERPTEPVTSGLPFGAGNMSAPTRPSGNTTSIVGKYLPTLESLAAQDDAPEPFRRFVQAVKANVDLGSVQ